MTFIHGQLNRLHVAMRMAVYWPQKAHEGRTFLSNWSEPGGNFPPWWKLQALHNPLKNTHNLEYGAWDSSIFYQCVNQFHNPHLSSCCTHCGVTRILNLDHRWSSSVHRFHHVEAEIGKNPNDHGFEYWNGLMTGLNLGRFPILRNLHVF